MSEQLSMPLEVYSRQAELVFIRDSNGLVISKMPFGNKDEAALIVRAVNAHAGLVKVCEWAAGYFHDFTEDDYEEDEIATALRAALKAAKGES